MLSRGTHAVGQPDDGVHRTALEEMIAVRISVRALELDVLRRRSRVAARDPPPGRVGDVRDRGGGAPLRDREWIRMHVGVLERMWEHTHDL